MDKIDKSILTLKIFKIMDKLISKSPVQRFKQGKKIVKAQEGTRFQSVGSTWFPGLSSITKEYVFYDHNTGDYITSKKPEITSLEGTINRGKSYSKYGYSWKEKEFARTPKSTSKSRDYSFMKGGTHQRNSIAEALLKDKKTQKYLKRQESQGFTAKPSVERKVGVTGISFKQAFNQARNSGLKEFNWGGRRFNTQKKGEEGFIWSNGKWVNPNIKFVAPSPTDVTLQEETEELNRKARPIVTQSTVQQNDFAQDKQNYYPSATTNAVSYNPNFNWKDALNLHYNTQFAKKGAKLLSINPVQKFKSNFRLVAQ